MNDEQRYNEALERAKDMLFHKAVRRENIEYIFPELKESKSEKIRKAIHIYLDWLDGRKDYQPKGDYTIRDMIDWVVKQGELASADKEESKFHYGDWITHNTANFVFKIIHVGFNGYEVVNRENYKKTISFDNEDNYRLWTIQDAKDGDVLYSIDSKQPFIYKERPQFSQARGYCCINKFGEFAIWNTSKCVICTDKYIPATKEQRDLLFQKMKEAGYEWEAEKKELKKIEPKTLNADKVIAWLVANICDYEYYVKLFKKDFEL